MPTKAEVEKLKQDWLKDPHWDIFDTEGFEAHRDELKAFQKKVEEQQRQVREQRYTKKAEELGISVEAAKVIEVCEHRAEHRGKAAKEMLFHYFRQAGIEGNDTAFEVGAIVDWIVEAATAASKVEMLKELGKLKAGNQTVEEEPEGPSPR